jgi:hypothetical protein
MIVNALVERLKGRSKQDFKGRRYEASLILQVISAGKSTGSKRQDRACCFKKLSSF